MERILMCLCVGSLVLAGCQAPEGRQWDQIKRLEQEKTEQAMRADALERENEHLRQQVATLSGLDADVRLRQLDTLVQIQLGKRTGLYDKDKDGRADSLLVYLEPIDSRQDTVKAIGTVLVELWDLSRPGEQARLSEWVLEPAQLQRHWGGNILSSYYRLPLNLNGVLAGRDNELTVKVTFTDLLTGKVLTAQTVILP